MSREEHKKAAQAQEEDGGTSEMETLSKNFGGGGEGGSCTRRARSTWTSIEIVVLCVYNTVSLYSIFRKNLL